MSTSSCIILFAEEKTEKYIFCYDITQLPSSNEFTKRNIFFSICFDFKWKLTYHISQSAMFLMPIHREGETHSLISFVPVWWWSRMAVSADVLEMKVFSEVRSGNKSGASRLASWIDSLSITQQVIQPSTDGLNVGSRFLQQSKKTRCHEIDKSELKRRVKNGRKRTDGSSNMIYRAGWGWSRWATDATPLFSQAAARMGQSWSFLVDKGEGGTSRVLRAKETPTGQPHYYILPVDVLIKTVDFTTFALQSHIGSARRKPYFL